jgi:formylglycine-generating enzyme required for sulfatase activity
LGITEVKRNHFQKFVHDTARVVQNKSDDGSTWDKPGYATQDDMPVSHLSHADASAFCEWISATDDAIYRLPTEAEWEFACRAGSCDPYFFGTDSSLLRNYAWAAVQPPQPRVVGSKHPNPFGLFDVYGNVGELCSDYYVATYPSGATAVDPSGPIADDSFPIRGGNFTSQIIGSWRSASRSNTKQTSIGTVGFRAVREITPPQPASAAKSSPPLAIAPFDAAQARAYQDAWAKHLGVAVQTKSAGGMELTLIPPGEFLMGSSDEQVRAAVVRADSRKPDNEDEAARTTIGERERPQHLVTLTKPFIIGTKEVSIGQYRQFVEATKYVTEAEKYGFGDSSAVPATGKNYSTMKATSWKACGYPTSDESSVTEITWNDACAFCNWLSQHDGLTSRYVSDGQGAWLIAATADGYHLPTEAQWEFACRAGTVTHYSFGDDSARFGEFAWHDKSAGNGMRAGGLLRANAFGLFDMHGNVFEWCEDWFEAYHGSDPVVNPVGPVVGSMRVIRGGAWNLNSVLGRSAYRSPHSPSYRYKNTGFRVARPLNPPNTNVPAQSTTATSVTTSDPESRDRSAARWVLSAGGKVTVLSAGKGPITLEAGDPLPSGEFAVQKIIFYQNRTVEAREFSNLARLDELETVDLNYTKIDDEVLDHLATCENLSKIILVSTRVSAEGIAKLAKLPRLKSLLLDYGTANDEILRTLATFPRLEDVTAFRTSVTAAGVRALAAAQPLKRLILSGNQVQDDWFGPELKLPVIETLELKQTPVTDDVVPALCQLTTLKNLSLDCTWISEKGLAKLRAVLPACRVTQESDDHAARFILANVGSGSLEVRIQSGQGEQSIKAVSGLPKPPFAVTEIAVNDSNTGDSTFMVFRGLNQLRKVSLVGTNVGNQTLTTLERCSSLRSLDIRKTKVTAAGVAKLQQALPNCVIEWDGAAKPAPTPTASGSR